MLQDNLNYLNFSIVRENNVNEQKIDEITDMILKMAKETENKNLDKVKVKLAIDKLKKNSNLGHYVVISDNDKYCGMNMVTFEYNVHENKRVLWLQSVFIDENYRNKGLFRKLLKENENFANDKEDFAKVVKLYMEKNNTKAEQVYLKLGFKAKDLVLYELDYDFDDISALKSEKEFNEQICDGLFTINIQKDTNINENNFWSLLTEDKVSQESIQNIMSIIKDESKGKVVYVKNQEGVVICLFFVFLEFSDWRNSLFWWVQDIWFNEDYRIVVDDNLKHFINTLVRLNYFMKSCGIRFITKSKHEETILKNTILGKSHYLIYEKEI